MKERGGGALQTPEIRKKGAPIHIIFGGHSEAHVGDLIHLDNAIGDKLQNTCSGNVVVFVEDADSLEEESERIEKSVAQGQRPSISFLYELFLGDHLRYPKPGDIDDFIDLINIRAKISYFGQEKLKILDKHFSSGRIRLLWESRPHEKLRQDMRTETYDRFNRYTTALDDSASAISEGNFKRGLEPFKRGTEDWAKDCSQRQDRLVSRIAAVAKDKDVVGVVGYIGHTHTRLGRLLSEGHNVTQKFPDIEKGKMLWSTAQQAVRYKQFFPDKELPELEWHRLMIGEAIRRTLSDSDLKVEKQTGRIKSGREIVELARSCLVNFLDMESIRQFENDVKEGNFIKLVKDRLARK